MSLLNNLVSYIFFGVARMIATEITWFLKASKTDINTENNYSKYDICDEEYLIGTSHIDDILECLTNMNYNVITYEFKNHYENFAKLAIYFEIDEYEEFQKQGLKKLINFRTGKYTTSSIYVKHITENSSNEDDNEEDNEDDNEWEKIYKKI
jgi:hypothetical protein